MGFDVANLSTQGWNLEEDCVQHKAQELADYMGNPYSGETVVLFSLFDNFVYEAEDGGQRAPLKRAKDDGRFHAKGKLVMVEPDAMSSMCRKTIPLFRAAGKAKKVIVGPMERYLARKCCDDPTHMTNHGNEAFIFDLAAKLTVLREALRETLHSRRLQRFKVTSLAKLIGLDYTSQGAGRQLAAYWGNDPVHLNEAGYRAVAEALTTLGGRGDTGFTNCGPDRSQDRTRSRASWVAGTDRSSAATAGGGRRSWSGPSGPYRMGGDGGRKRPRRDGW